MPFGYSTGGGISMSQDFYNQPQELIPQARNVLGLPPASSAIGQPASTSPGTITGAAPLAGNPAVGFVPGTSDPLLAIQRAIEGYTKTLPSLIASANQQTAANQQAVLNETLKYYPQLLGNTAQIGSNIGDLVSGRVSTGTTNYLNQLARQWGQATGVGALSPAATTNLFLHAGITAEDLAARGAAQQATLLGSLPKTTPTSVSSLGITPEGIANLVNTAQIQADLYRAAFDPAARYNLEKANALEGLGAGGAAGRGPYAGTPTTGGTSSPEILKLLQDLINRGSGTSTGSQTSAYYAQPTAATFDTTPYTDYFTEQDPYYSDLFTPDTGTPVTDNVPYTDYFGPQDPYFQDLFQG